MRIVLVDTTLGGDLIGGAQTFLIKLLTGLGSAHEVRLLSGGTPGERVRNAIEASKATTHSNLWSRADLVDYVTPNVAAWVNDLRPDVFVVSVSADIGWTVLPLLDPRIATVTIGHNDQETFYAPVKHYHSFLTRAIGVSDEICRKYVDECGMPAERVEWIPYGVGTRDDQPVTSEGGPVKLVYVGRFENTQKRIADVVKIVKQLTETGIDFTVDIVGDGEEMPSVRSALSDEIEAGRVGLHGWVDSSRVLETMRSSEVFILASAYEGFCISLIEAMANGCCPIVTDIESGNKQLVSDDVNGFVVPVADVDGFVDRISRLAGDRVRLGRMRKAAWETGREYSVDRMVENYERCFERAVADARSNARIPDPAFPLMESCRSKYPLWLRRIKIRMKSVV
jgi:glycosyltransferase involved in cell wall biosynthesis